MTLTNEWLTRSRALTGAQHALAAAHLVGDLLALAEEITVEQRARECIDSALTYAQARTRIEVVR